MAAPRYALPVVLLLALVGAAVLAARMLDSLARTAGTDAGGATKRSAPIGAAPEGARDAERTAEDAPPTPAASAPEGPPLLPAERRHADFTARIEDAVGAPVADVDVRLDSSRGGFERGFEIADDRAVHVRAKSGADGRVRVARLAEGVYRLAAHADDGRIAYRTLAFRVATATEPMIVTLEEPTWLGITGDVGVEIAVVDEGGAPVPGTAVELHGGVRGDGVVGCGERPPLQATSDANGRAIFAGIDWTDGLATARTPDGRAGSARISIGERDLDSPFWTAKSVVVRPTGRIAGTLVDVPDADRAAVERALAGATVDAFLATTQEPWNWTFGVTFTAPLRGRSFEFEGLAPGNYSFVMHAPAGARLVLDRFRHAEELPNSVVPAAVTVTSGATADVVLRVTCGATIRGRVHLPDGTPIANATILAVFAPRTSNFPDGFVLHGVNVWRFDQENDLGADHPLTHVRARSDARGEYVVAGLQPGEQRVIVTSRGLSFDRREGVAVADGTTTALDHELELAGALQGIAPENSYVGITRTGDAQPTAIAVLGYERSFTFAGLRPGEYAVAQFHSDASIAPVEYARATVVAGKTTYVDLTDAKGPFEIAGRVLDATGPVVDAVITLLPRSTAVDGEGRFAFPCYFPTEQFDLCVRSRRIGWYFYCDARSNGGRGWQGEVRLGDETLRIETVGPRGAPLAGSLSLTWVRTEYGGTEGGNATLRAIEADALPLDATGRITIDRLAAAHYGVRLKFANGTEVAQVVDLPRQDVLQIVAPASATLEARVVDADGKPVPNWNVIAASWQREGPIPDDVEGHDEWFQWNSAVTDRRGVARIAGVRAGPVIVRVTEPEAWSQRNSPDAPPPLRIVVEEDEVRPLEIRLRTARAGGR